MNDLERRLLTFLGQQDGAESIDDLHLGASEHGTKRADFFLANRAVIAEVKSIYSDPLPKIEAAIAPHRDRPEFPHFYGEADVAKVVAHLPDGDAIMRQIAQRLTRSIESAFTSADKQIASTKRAFGCNLADGVLVLANEDVTLLTLEVIAWQLGQLLCKQGTNDAARYPHINMVWVLSEAHRLVHPEAVVSRPT